MDRLTHGYTNRTRRVQIGIEKCYEGFEASARAHREFACLANLSGRFPVPEVLRFDPSIPTMVLAEVVGRHGQELIGEGQGALVLRLLGICLGELQSLDVATVFGLSERGEVLVHGDFGPQNAIFSADLRSVCAVLDWEFAHLGSPIEDLAWAEWIVRMHHPGALDDLPELFAGAGLFFHWSDRQAAMVLQCRSHIAHCEESRSEAAAAEWGRRLRATESWRE